MSKLAERIADLHRPIDKALYRALSFLLAMGHAGAILWDPKQYSEWIGGFNPVISPLLIWAICSGMIFAVGFVPHKWGWRLFFSPYLSLLILIYLSLIGCFV